MKLGNKDDVKPKDVANALALATNSDVVQVIGRTATLFRENPEMDKKRGRHSSVAKVMKKIRWSS